MGFQSKSGGWAVLALALASCAGGAVDVPRPPARDWKAEARGVLDGLEGNFYRHWGAVDGTAEYARLEAGHVPALREIADSNREHALMALRVLGRLAPGERFSRDARAILYVTALGRERNFLRWGVIGPRGFIPAVYGQELLREGAAAPYLKKLLGDRRRAVVFGDSEGERVNRLQGDRVCDYAWIFLATMFDRPLAYGADPRDRDPQIRELEAWLDRRR